VIFSVAVAIVLVGLSIGYVVAREPSTTPATASWKSRAQPSASRANVAAAAASRPSPPPTVRRLAAPPLPRKLAGNLPPIASLALPGGAPAISARICVDHRGAVASVHLPPGVPAAAIGELVRAITSWRYEPSPAGQDAPSAICFDEALRFDHGNSAR
jgi:hypothetical protein